MIVADWLFGQGRQLSPGLGEWLDSAACAEVVGNWFPNLPTDDVSAEKAICRGCPVQSACLTYAYDHGEAYGIWGGRTAEERLYAALRHRAAPRTPAGPDGPSRVA